MLPLLIGGDAKEATGETIEEAEELPDAEDAETAPDAAEDPRERPQSAA